MKITQTNSMLNYFKINQIYEHCIVCTDEGLWFRVFLSIFQTLYDDLQKESCNSQYDMYLFLGHGLCQFISFLDGFSFNTLATLHLYHRVN